MKKLFHFPLSHTLSLLFLILVTFDDSVIPDGTLRRWGFVPLFFCYQDGTDVTAALSRRQLREAAHYKRVGKSLWNSPVLSVSKCETQNEYGEGCGIQCRPLQTVYPFVHLSLFFPSLSSLRQNICIFFSS